MALLSVSEYYMIHSGTVQDKKKSAIKNLLCESGYVSHDTYLDLHR